MAVNEQLESTLEQAVESMGFEWVGCEWAKEGAQPILRIYADKEGGITLDDCAKVSRELGAILDVEDFLIDAYRLEVSSPGIERPLFRLSHYAKYVGQRVALRLKVPVAGQRRFQGIIDSVEGETIRIQVDDREEILELVCAQIDKANLQVSI